MKIALVICEYNPFQNGHAYHLAQTRSRAKCDKIVCIMSGNVTQRGELTIADKYTRAAWAILSGADMVVELPPQYVLTTAKYFALGGVKIANAIDGEKYLSFGSECEDFDLINKISLFEENADFKALLDGNLKQGMGYAKSFSLALENFSPKFAEIISRPNNTLAIEYLRAIRQIAKDVTPINVARKGGDYHDDKYCEIFSSASAVRKMADDGDTESLKKSVPPRVFEYLKNFNKNEKALKDGKLFSIIKYAVQNYDPSQIHGVKEGVENRILKAAKTSASLNDFFDNVATKRYTNSYLARTVMNMLIGNTFTADELCKSDVEYVNVLAVEENSKDLLSKFKCSVNTKNSTLPPDSLILSADRLYSSIDHNFPSSMSIVKRL
ncbi:MAG: nucleotidyltransferase family protein [Clostridia bacterium]|nr:nucleotidyltransferase family protein [Clostridia bacterium]